MMHSFAWGRILLIVINTMTYETLSLSYCNLKSCPDKSHTMCRYSSDYAPECGDKSIIESGMSSNQKKEVIDTHNNLRHFVACGNEKRGDPGPQPPATNMGPVTWDDELATIAQRWANQCVFGHDDCRDTERFEVGQNVAFASSSKKYPNNMTSLIMQWYEEVNDLDKKHVKSMGDNPSLHYTQMIWADSEYVGCGLIKFKKNNRWYTTQIVCNYGPTGNIEGMPIYET
ncbi:venom allergen 5-like [Chelonus insularis]|uniref:venom allergen 5-like n=1 Tax=Chelonus insularis TaxID=460826 RepID=UPI00158C21E4|nr:venom allergen 5-like [Chelonus insularis]